MSRLFVDCDDTLVLWREAEADKSGGLYRGDLYVLNRPLIADIGCFLSTHKNYSLVVWSGGGPEYAEHWARLCFPNGGFEVIEKDLRVPEYPDILVDDMGYNLRLRDRRIRVLVPSPSFKCPLCHTKYATDFTDGLV